MKWGARGIVALGFSCLVATACGAKSETGDKRGETSSGTSSGMGGVGTTSAGGSTSVGGSGTTGSGTTSTSASIGGSAATGAGGSSGPGDACGGCPDEQLCTYQIGGPGPGRYLCASYFVCRSADYCTCIEDQGTCAMAPEDDPMAGVCQCDNGLE